MSPPSNSHSKTSNKLKNLQVRLPSNPAQAHERRMGRRRVPLVAAQRRKLPANDEGGARIHRLPRTRAAGYGDGGLARHEGLAGGHES